MIRKIPYLQRLKDYLVLFALKKCIEIIVFPSCCCLSALSREDAALAGRSSFYILQVLLLVTLFQSHVLQLETTYF